MKDDQEERYTVLITRMDGTKEEYNNLSTDDIINSERLISINVNGEGVRFRHININTVKEFDVFK